MCYHRKAEMYMPNVLSIIQDKCHLFIYSIDATKVPEDITEKQWLDPDSVSHIVIQCT